MEENDPYRVLRKTDADFDESPGLKEVKPVHSRAASESSTTNLTTRDYFYNEDPYARHEDKRQQFPSYRANSYLPYSHHKHDPNTAMSPVFIEDGSISNHDRTISLQVDSSHSAAAQQGPNPLTSKTHSALFAKHKRRRRGQSHWCCCCCGESSLPVRHRRLLTFLSVLLVAALGVVWFFCWPRVPSLWLAGLDDLSSSQNSTFMNMDGASNSSIVFNTTWSVNVTVNNSQNWIPTNIDNIAIHVLNRNTSALIGQGSSGSLILRPRVAGQLVTVNLTMYYVAETEDDDAIKNLYNACYTQNKDATMSALQSALDVDFMVDIKTHGIIWTSRTKVSTPDGVPCPT